MTRHKYHFLSSILRQIVLVMWLPLAGLVQGAGGLDVWQWRNPLPQGNHLHSAASGDGKLVVVGSNNTILVSTNPSATPSSWKHTSINMPGLYSLKGITYHDSLFVLVGDGIWTSTNAFDWVRRRSDIHFAVTWANGQFISVGHNGGIMTSPDGLSWTVQNSGTSQPLNEVTYGDGKYVVVGGYYTNSVILTSVDGVQWVDRTPSSDALNGVAYGNGKFVATGFYWDGSTGVVLTSPDGIIWSRHVQGPEMYSAHEVTYQFGMFITAAYNGVLTSVDGVNWVRRYAEIPSSFVAVTSHNDELFAVGNAGAIITSADGLSWQRYTLGTWNYLYDIAKGNGTLVVTGGRGALLTSEDGEGWVLQHHEDTSFSALAFGNGVFVGSARWSSQFIYADQIYISADGKNWEVLPAVSEGFIDLAFGNGKFVGISRANAAGSVVTSINGRTWTSSTTPPDRKPYALTYGNGLFVTVGPEGDIFTSSDTGLTWHRQGSGVENDLYAVGFGNGLFVTGDYYGNILTSTNGTNWVKRHVNSINEYSENEFRGVTYANGTYVSIGSDTVLSSTNAVDWTHHRLPTSSNFHDIIDLDGSFIMVGDHGAILQSSYITPPAIVRTKMDLNGFWLSITGQQGRPYRIQCSSGFGADSAWLDWMTYTNGLNRQWVVDSEANDYPKRFYRLVSP